MKKILFIITLFALMHQSQAQIVNIPDANFKNALLNTLCVDTNGDGVFNDDVDTNNDNEIQVSEAEAIVRLKVSSQSIVTLEGIEKFTNLTGLYCDFNQLTTLDISQNDKLETLNCLVNNLTSLEVSQNSNLTTLYCGFNQLTTLDISLNPNLTSFWCYTNQLTSLNLKNGTNDLLLSMFAQDNNNLTCIEVDDVEFAKNTIAWSKDATANYNENCGVLGVDDLEDEIQILCYPNPVSTILKIKIPVSVKINRIKVYDAFGQLVMDEKTHFEQLDVSNLNQGLFLVIIETNNNSFTKKIVKK